MRVLVVSPVAFAGSRQIGGTRTYTLGLLNSLRILGEDVWLAGLRGCNRDGRQGVVVADIDTCSTIRFLLGLCRNIISCRRLYPDVISIQLSLAGLPFLLSNVPLGRMGMPEEVADVAIYLASDAAEWVTGTVVDINGGQTCLAQWGQPYFRDASYALPRRRCIMR